MKERQILEYIKTFKANTIKEFEENKKKLDKDLMGNMTLLARQIQVETMISVYTKLQQIIESNLEPEIDTHSNKDVRKLMQLTYDAFKNFETRLDLCVDEVCSNIKIEYDEAIKVFPNFAESGDLIMAKLEIKPMVIETNIPVKYTKE